MLVNKVPCPSTTKIKMVFIIWRILLRAFFLFFFFNVGAVLRKRLSG